MTPITNFEKWLQGQRKLPAGAVPLAADPAGSVVALTAFGTWIRWAGTISIQSMPPSTQKGVMTVLVGQMGGTSAAMAERLKVSPRTVEAWRSGKSPLPISKGLKIAEILSA
jgi:DNA-binding transcriptional regulator YdaS (Cro superfamily)